MPLANIYLYTHYSVFPSLLSFSFLLHNTTRKSFLTSNSSHHTTSPTTVISFSLHTTSFATLSFSLPHLSLISSYHITHYSLPFSPPRLSCISLNHNIHYSAFPSLSHLSCTSQCITHYSLPFSLPRLSFTSSSKHSLLCLPFSLSHLSCSSSDLFIHYCALPSVLSHLFTTTFTTLCPSLSSSPLNNIN